MQVITHETSRWEDPQERAIFLADYAAGSRFGQLHGTAIKNFTFDTAAYPFAALVKDLLVEKALITRTDADALESLADLHKVLPASAMALDTGELNQVSRSFYEQGDAFTAIYRRFIAEVLADGVLQGDCYFQRTPTIRFHFPHQSGFAWRPRFHNDVMLGHPPHEINVWLPLCRTEGSASMRLAPLADSLELLESVQLDFDAFAKGVQTSDTLQQRCQDASRSLELNYGEFVAFDSRCLHATQFNDSEQSRVSIDLRVVPVEHFAAITLPYRGTGRLRMPFRPGAYYDEATAWQAVR